MKRILTAAAFLAAFVAASEAFAFGKNYQLHCIYIPGGDTTECGDVIGIE